jgi:5-methylcytosine-specific restriction enzyme subunit McrC
VSYPVARTDLRGGREWQPWEKSDLPESVDLAVFAAGFGREHTWNLWARGRRLDAADNSRTLGLHRCDSEAIRCSHFIGAVRLGEGADAPCLCVAPKLERLDLAAIFTAVLSEPSAQTGVEFDRLFGCDSAQAPIDGVQWPQLTLLEVTAYLYRLAEFVRRHLREDFRRVEENLVGRVRGRVLIADQVRENLVRARPDRMVCEFTVLGRDTPENRILKAALETGLRWLHQQPPSVVPAAVWHWGTLGRAALTAVPLQRINPRDWATARRHGAMCHYAEPLALARLVLTRLHLDPSGGAVKDQRTVPFFLDANRLFEAWVGVCLGHAGCQPEAQRKGRLALPDGYRWTFRPDFLVTPPGSTDRGIVDAKYKPGDLENSDLFQIIGYTRLVAPSGTVAGGVCQGGGLPAAEAWFAVPVREPLPVGLSVASALGDFADAWEHRADTAACWPDGFKVGVVSVPLPTMAEPVAGNHGG